jgi:hypothetical protein
MSPLYRFAGIGLLAVAFGCTPADESAPELERPKTEWKGEIDDRFVSVWSTDSGSTYTLTDDGGFHLEGVVKTQGGEFKNDVRGKWLVDGEKMLFQDASGNVVPYMMKLNGDTLTLTTVGTLKKATVLKRKASE